jgi:hypothetical protein
MDRQAFFTYLRKGGRTEDVADRVIRLVTVYAEFMEGSGKDLDTAVPKDLEAFTLWAEEKKSELPKHDEIIPSPRSYLWAIKYYYRFIGNEEMVSHAGLLREARIKRKPFPLKDFRGVDPDHAQALKDHKINNINQMLKAGKTPEMRRQLTEKTGVPENAILEFVRLSDLARIQGIKSIRARLYLDAGIDSIEKMASMTKEEILKATRKFIEETYFDGIPPLPGEVEFSINKAKKLPIIVEE